MMMMSASCDPSKLRNARTKTMTMITRSVSYLYTKLGFALRASAHSLFGEMFASWTKNLSRYSCAGVVPLGMKWSCNCAGNVDVIYSR